MTNSYPISKPLADLITVFTDKPRSSRSRNFEYPRYYPDDHALITTNSSKLLIYTCELPFPNTLLELVKRTDGYQLVPIDTPVDPLPYTRVIPTNYPSEPDTILVISKKKSYNYVPITRLIAQHQLFINYTFFEQLHKYPGIYDVYIPGPTPNNPLNTNTGRPINDSRERPIKLIHNHDPLTLILMPFRNDYKNSH